MVNERRDIEIIDAWLRGELDDDMQHEFDRRKEDPEFNGLLGEMKRAEEAIRSRGRQDLRRKLKSWDGSSATTALIRRRTVMGVAASLLILVVAYFVFRPSGDLGAIAENYIEPYPNVVAPIQKGSGDEPTPYQQAFQLYEMGYYDKAEDQFALLDQDDESVQFYAAVTALLDDEIALAITRLETIINQPQHRYNTAAKWYGALAYLLNDQKSDAIVLLDQVAEGNSPLAGSARSLLDDIL